MSYKTSRDLLDHSNCVEANPPAQLDYMKLPSIKESFTNPQTQLDYMKLPMTNLPSPIEEHEDRKIYVEYVEQDHPNSGNPEVWGPAFWFSLHNGALRFPENASPTWRDRMKNFILGIPVMVPCEKCSVHATAYIENNYDKLDTVVSNKDTLFEFFCNFHNYVNKRLDKPEMSIDDALAMYSSPAKVTKLQVRY